MYVCICIYVYKRELNLRSFIQLSETLPIELTGLNLTNVYNYFLRIHIFFPSYFNNVAPYY